MSLQPKCPQCGLVLLLGGPSVMWRQWYYSHHIDLLCECYGIQIPVSLETQFPDYPLEQRMKDLKS